MQESKKIKVVSLPGGISEVDVTKEHKTIADVLKSAKRNPDGFSAYLGKTEVTLDTKIDESVTQISLIKTKIKGNG